ncbi:glycosyl hydrolase family 2, sugar binding domain protein [Rhodopirellula maiorica SM1]|uniref:beta-galactosidase n=1 Tax=Rhodopirellula maiorica SM1 TaxID=1265738 RepID=M5R856_9BACT|nr:discoidin domain-containing protein [Rhodopirellula maiorica]EMI15663.1 glycosyl hydrolase family 2, sugar binding domain protein [Rhodopirellula maiorica SM1]
MIDLSGTWQVRLAGEPQSHDVRLPGALRDSGIGQPPGPETKWIADGRDKIWNRPEFKPFRTADNFKIPFWLQPERHYVGKATYQREIRIPDPWSGQRIVLTLERPHWRTRVLVDGKQVGRGESLGVAHQFDLTEHVNSGVHQLAIEVDNSLDEIDVGINSHSVSDHTQSAWHGIVGAMTLSARRQIDIQRVDIRPDVDTKQVRADVVLTNSRTQSEKRYLVVKVSQDGQTLASLETAIDIQPGQSISSQALTLERLPRLWDEFEPHLCDLSVTVLDRSSERERMADERSAVVSAASAKWTGRFGFRKIQARDGRLVLNDRPIFLRGTLECCIFPLTGYPPTDVASWQRIIRICKQHGLNHIRFHSWCPPEAAFVAADEMGFYFQVECSSWPNQSVSLGRGLPIDQWIYREADRVLAAYGNHPSFMLFCAGNEPNGVAGGGKFLTPWVERYKAREDRVLVTAGAGWPIVAANDYHIPPRPRIQQWGEELRSRINAEPPETVTDYRKIISRYSSPVVAHEIGQWCVYPNFDEMAKYTGTLKPKNFEIFRSFLDDAGMLHQANDFLMASGRLQVLTYKEEIEAALRTPGFGGFQLLDLRDFPGQGTALVGMLDPFWDSKPYMDPSEFRKFCGPVVPLARMSKRVWQQHETFVATVDLSHFGNKPLDGSAAWVLRDSGNHGDNKVIGKGQWTLSGQMPGELYRIGTIECPLADVRSASKLTLEVMVDDERQSVANDWDVWVYPSAVSDDAIDRDADARSSDHPVVTTSRVSDAVAAAERGERVILTLDPNHVETDVQIGMSPIFWNWAWTNGQAPHTLGILCDPDQACFEGFPTDFHSNWQWWELISKSAAMPIDHLPATVSPLIQVVPNWFRPERLALAWEAKLGTGRILVTSMDLKSQMDQRPVARQLLHSLKRYVASPHFDPVGTVTPEQVATLLRELSPTQQAILSSRASSMQGRYEPFRAFDGKLETMWHTQWNPLVSPPHWIEVTLDQTYQLDGIRLTARQDQAATRLRGYQLLIHDDAGDWKPVASGQLKATSNPEEIHFANPLRTDRIRIQAGTSQTANGISATGHVSIAELELLFAESAAEQASQ